MISDKNLRAFRKEIDQALLVANRLSNRPDGWNRKLARRLKIPVETFNVWELTPAQCHIVKYYLQNIITHHLTSPLDKVNQKV